MLSSNLQKFNGKELQTVGSSSLRFLDYGARMYDPTTVRWLTQDPMAEKYYGYSPYNYCVGNPVLYVDPNGTETYVQDKGEGKYQVCGGKLNDDRNLYLMDENNKFVLDQKGNRQSIGESMTNYSFYDEETERWHDDVIDFNDMSGENFVYERTHNLLPLLMYMITALHGGINDFKITNGKRESCNLSVFRGMPVTIRGTRYIASARDVGNYVAGYYAGAHGFSWTASRRAFDKYQGSIEGIQTQRAQKLGWKEGNSVPKYNKIQNLVWSIPSRKWILPKTLQYLELILQSK